MQRIRDLQAELEALRKDEDVKEIEQHSVHRRKRVKIDDLSVIPHNRPGDSSSTFRVPEIDSDDEMEVDESVETGNMFEKAGEAMVVEDVQPTPAAAPPPPVFKRPEPASVTRPTTTAPVEKESEKAKEKPRFNFPSVGKRPAGYQVSDEYRLRAKTAFQGGLERFLAARVA
jgi:hypothetical protein